MYIIQHHPSRNASIRDIVILQEYGLVPAKRPFARVIQVHKGKDGLVPVVTIKTHKRPCCPLGTELLSKLLYLLYHSLSFICVRPSALDWQYVCYIG